MGSVFCHYTDQNDFNLFDKLERSRPEYVELDYRPSQILKLDDTRILVSSVKDKILALYDHKLNLTKKIQKINSACFAPCGLATSQDGSVFMANVMDGTLMKLNKDFELVKAISNPYNIPYTDIQIHRNLIYACIGHLKRIDVLSLDLVLLHSHHLDYEPYRVRIVNDTACVSVHTGWFQTKNIFYNLTDFKVIGERKETGLTLAYQNLFYGFERDEVKVLDRYGKPINRKVNRFGAISNAYVDNETFYGLLDRKILVI